MAGDRVSNPGTGSPTLSGWTGKDIPGGAADARSAGTAPPAFSFAGGTQVATPRGPVAVELLQVGDLVVTAAGEQRPIRRLDHRVVDCRLHRDPRAVWPVRIAAHALGPRRPARDLLVSPDHAIGVTVVEEVLVPVSRLLNGSTVARVAVDTVSYWHVGLESHDILLAEELPAESSPEVGDRSLAGDRDGGAPPERGCADACRPVVEGGPILDFTRRRLDDRADQAGWRASHAVNLVLSVDGGEVAGLAAGSTFVFLIPSTAQEVRLRSDIFVSDDFNGWGDRRQLGAALQSLALLDTEGRHRRVPLDDARLAQGFFALADGPGRRWTNGDAVLDPALWDGMSGPITLHISLDLSNIRAWQAPSPTAPSPTAPGTPPRAGLRLVG